MKFLFAALLALFCLQASAQADTIPGRAMYTNGFSSFIDTKFNQHLPRFSVECWAKSPQAPNSRQGKGPVHYEENFQINWDHVSGGARHALVLRDSAGSWHGASFGEDWEPDTWYHLAGTYDGVMMKAYRNGKLMTANPEPNGPARQEPATLKIGKHARLSGPEHEFHEGTTDEVRVWSRALSEQEIRENMHKTLSGNEQGLVLYYQFNEWPVAAGLDSTLEKVSGRNSAILVQNPVRRPSTAPVGKAESASSNIASTPGDYGTLYDVRFTTTQISQGGQLTATSLSTSIVGDTFTRSQGKVITSNYWIVNHDGLLQCEGKTALLMPEANYMELEAFRPFPLWLLHRASNSDKAWKPLRTASLEQAMGAPFVMLEFDTLVEGQFIIGRIDTSLITTRQLLQVETAIPKIWISERNIRLKSDETAWIGECRLEVYNLQGKKVIDVKVDLQQNTQTILSQNFVSGSTYLWRCSNNQKRCFGKVLAN